MPYFWPLLPPTPPVLPPTPPTPFVALQGSPRKAEEIKLLVPPWMETRYPSHIGAVLHAMGIEDHRVTVGDRTLFIRGANPAGNVLYVAKQDDASIRVWQQYPPTQPSSLSVTVSGKDILVVLATDSLGNVITTPTDLRTALAANPASDLLVGLTTFGSENEPVGSVREYTPLDPDGLEGARRDIMLGYSRGDNLSVIGNNYGLSKPFLLALTDDQFRAYIGAIAFQKKVNRAIIEGVLTVIFGPKSTAGWDVYESLRRKTITIEVTVTQLPTGPASGTFLRAGTAAVSTVYWTGDYLRADAVPPAWGHVAIRPGGIASLPLSAVSGIANNSVYARMHGASRPILLDVMKLIRAAGVQVEFLQRRE